MQGKGIGLAEALLLDRLDLLRDALDFTPSPRAPPLPLQRSRGNVGGHGRDSLHFGGGGGGGRV